MPEDSIEKLTEIIDQELQDRMLEADEAFERADYGKASLLYALILEDYPDNLDALLKQGICFRVQGNPRGAIEYFKKMLDIRKDILSAWNNIGNCYLDLGDKAKSEKKNSDATKYYEKALRCFDRALKINENSWKTLNNKGEALIRLGKSAVGYKLKRKAAVIRRKFPE